MRTSKPYIVFNLISGEFLNGNNAGINLFLKERDKHSNPKIDSFFKNKKQYQRLVTKIKKECCIHESNVSMIDAQGKEKYISLSAKSKCAEQNNHAVITIESTSDSASRKISPQILNELEILKYGLDKAAIVFITNSNGIIEYVNDNFCNLSLYSKEELIGNTPQILNSGFHPKTFFEDLWNTIKKGETWRGDIKNKNKNGGYYWVDTVIVPFLDNKGVPCQYFSIRYDITSKKNEELEKEKLLKEKEVLLSEVHHRVKNNLQIICSLINFKKYNTNSNSKIDDLTDIHGKVVSMSLVHDEAYKTSNYAKIDILNYLTRLEYYIANTFSPQEIKFKLDGESIHIKLDTTINIGIILSEIISNYMKHTLTDKTPTFIVSFSQKNGKILIKVQDNGKGFPNSVLNKTQTGMGLELIAGIVKQLNGKFNVYNNNGAVYEIAINEV